GVSAGCDAAPFEIASSTSPFRTCPRLPEPFTSSTAILFSASSLAADGAGGALRGSISPASPAVASTLAAASLVVDAAPVPAACATASFLVSDPAAFFGAAAAAPSPIVPSTAPTSTVSPSCTVISASVPDAGAGTSSVTLSVSSSSSGSSAATASPAFLNHLPTVASVTDSPSVGTLISVAI